ncbi:hypothetical protein ACOSQ3_006007 [Xanthoceras sorbifolium]
MSSSGPVASDSVSVPGGVGTAPVEVDLGVSGKKKGDDSVVTDSVPVPNSTVLAPLVSAVSEVSEISVADSSVPIDQCAHMDFTPVLSADLVADLPVSDPKTVAADIIKEAVMDCSTIIINSDVGIRRAIGVPELDQYLCTEGIIDEKTRVKYLEAAIDKIKENTRMLACRQLEKIQKFYNWK